MTTWGDAHQAALAALAKDKWNKAIRELAPWLGRTAPDLDDAAWSVAVGVLAAVTGKLHAETEDVALRAAGSPDDPDALYELGHALVEVKRPDLAVAVLARSVARAPAAARSLAELAAALELLGRNAEVNAALDARPSEVAGDPLLAYLRGFNAVMVGDLDTARGLVARVAAAADERVQFMAGRLVRVLARADALVATGGLARDDLRGWHYALTGGILERTARHGDTWDTPARVKASLINLGVIVDALGLDAPAVLHPPERTSEVLAGAAAALLGRPAQPWHGGDERGLLVIYDARDLIPDYRRALVHHRAGQPLYLRAAEHTTEQPTAADLGGYLYAKNTSPWGPGFTRDLQLIDTSKVPLAELVAAVVGAGDTDDVTDQAGLRAFCARVRDLDGDAAPAARRDRGQRERLWVGSPVAKLA